jgi:hypothetical protein
MTTVRFVTSLLVTALCVAAYAAPPGTLIITDRRIESGGDYAKFEKEVQANRKTVLKKSGDGWHVYFVAYMRRPPGAPDINIVFYDMAEKKREPVNAFPIKTQPSAKILISEVEIKPEDGFKVGGKYRVLITRLINGREEVYAQTTLELAN